MQRPLSFYLRLESASRALLFTRLVLAKAFRDGIALKAAALAFVTIVSLVPLMAAFSFVGARMFESYDQQRVLGFLTEILPYSEDLLMEKIQGFLDQAESIRQLGALAFLAVTLTLLGTIEQTINEIWRVSAGRNLRRRLLSLTLLLFWGPVVIGASLSGIVLIRQRYAVVDFLFHESTLIGLLPMVISLVGLSMLYWLVPNTEVRFRSALLGGSAAALLLEALRRSFTLLTGGFREYGWIVYGSFFLAFLFMISIQFVWAIVLLGAEVAYTSQYFSSLRHERQHRTLYLSRWIGLASLAIMTRRFLRGEPITGRGEIAARLELTPEDTDRVLGPLLGAGLLSTATSRGRDGYVLSADPHQLPISSILAAYDVDADRTLVAAVEEGLSARLRAARQRVESTRGESLQGLTLARLAEGDLEEMAASSPDEALADPAR